MSMRQVLDIVEALLQDETVGLRPLVERLAVSLPNAPTGDPGPISADFTYFRGHLPGLRPTNGGGNIMLRPQSGDAKNRLLEGAREGVSRIEVGYETFGSPEDNVNQATLVLTALRQCLDGLREFADANVARFGPSVVDVDETMEYNFGDFDGPTVYGFLARFPITEWSNE